MMTIKSKLESSKRKTSNERVMRWRSDRDFK